MVAKGAIYFVLIFLASNSLADREVSLLWNSEKGYTFLDGQVSSKETVAWGLFKDEIKMNGWSYLEIKTSSQFSDQLQANGAGYLEAYLTKDLIWNYWRNLGETYCSGTMQTVCDLAMEFKDKNLDWIKDQLAVNECPEGQETCDPYWHHVRLAYEQLNGIIEGYDLVQDDPEKRIPKNGIMLLNLWHDMEDLAEALKVRHNLRVTFPERIHTKSCSALIKRVEATDELFFGHVTWSLYNRMVRVMKKYDFNFRETLQPGQENLPGRVTVFSGYPGVTVSGDDFNAMHPSQLASMETTIGNMNDDLWQFVTEEGTLFYFVRMQVANWLAKSGQEWTEIFARHNSGTYNNEYMIVDFNKLNGGDQKDILWVIDQLPGMTRSEDLTDRLMGESYFPSYNTPVFPEIFEMGGGVEQVKKYGDWWSYDKNPRALIFKQEQAGIHNITDMQRVMRWNRFLLNDTLTACDCSPLPFNGENAISARSDLNPEGGQYPFSSLDHRNHGAIDMKILSKELMRDGLQFRAISGPTDQDVPAFEWDQSGFNENYFGLPNKWSFPAVTHKWSMDLP